MSPRPRLARNDVCWADLGGDVGRRPVVVLTRDAAAAVLDSVTVAPVTRTVRGIRSEVPLGPQNGLPTDCVANCDHLMTIRAEHLDAERVGTLTLAQRAELDDALRYALDILG